MQIKEFNVREWVRAFTCKHFILESERLPLQFYKSSGNDSSSIADERNEVNRAMIKTTK